MTQQTSHGTYVEFRLSKESQKSIVNRFAEEIDNMIDPDKFHCTIAFSRKEFDPGFTKKKINEFGVPNRIQRLGDEGAVALMIESSAAHYWHHLFRNQYGATFDYNHYQPHITLSYDSKRIPSQHSFDDVIIEFNRMIVSKLDLN